MKRFQQLRILALIAILFHTPSTFAIFGGIGDAFSCSDDIDRIESNLRDLKFTRCVGKYDQLRALSGVMGLSQPQAGEDGVDAQQIRDWESKNIVSFCTLSGAAFFAADLCLKEVLGPNPEFTKFSAEKREAIRTIWEQQFLIDQHCGANLTMDHPRIAGFYFKGNTEDEFYRLRDQERDSKRSAIDLFGPASKLIHEKLLYLSRTPE